ncbi:hypothetical protein [Streptomyces sp. NRRL B-1140]|nr:hypothetical protein [Streptomyces sp. NRRL B-1140]
MSTATSIVGAQAAVLRVPQMTGVDRIIGCYPTTEQARAGWRA